MVIKNPSSSFLSDLYASEFLKFLQFSFVGGALVEHLSAHLKLFFVQKLVEFLVRIGGEKGVQGGSKPKQCLETWRPLSIINYDV